MNVVRKFIDIGANLTDPMYGGKYHGSQKHASDLEAVLERAWQNGLSKIIITGGSFSESKEALELSRKSENLYSTVGCHPTRCNEFTESGEPENYLQSLSKLIEENKDKVVAVGECGLDYDRLHFCSKDVQKTYFEEQLKLVGKFKLPLFLHCRNAAPDLIEILEKHKDNLCGGVIHSFDGTKEEADKFLDMEYYIGLNGCSLKTEDNLKVVGTLPLEKILIETDSPWCEVRPTHAGFKYVKTFFPAVKKEKWQADKLVKARNEPCQIIQVLEIIAGVRNEDPNVICEQIFQNTDKLFFTKAK
ncbi:Deoxyribonuclease TATDN1 [Gryllus bimaculatus]|nr:Deoxyribonuclease TATDN1 [Gryllus bimaculatus]